MDAARYDYEGQAPIAIMGGVYGNVPALQACLEDALVMNAGVCAFLGDMIGFCGHSDETVALVKSHFQVVIAGNREHNAARGDLSCGCGHADAQDEKYGCIAHQYSLHSLCAANAQWFGVLPEKAIIQTGLGNVLLCHGSPDQTNEFLYEDRLVNARLESWLRTYDAVGMACTHTGFPWVRQIDGKRFAVNCGSVGKSDNDGDPAVHYALLRPDSGTYRIEIRRVEYDHVAWAAQLAREGVDPVFVTPIRTGTWTFGVPGAHDKTG
jgi:diadenosine tetraphosphatase ApaH/serine/threonine PP2A family protein phosphatase